MAWAAIIITGCVFCIAIGAVVLSYTRPNQDIFG